MTRFGINVRDTGVRDSLRELKGNWSDAPTFKVGPGVEYAIYLEFGRGPVEADSADALQFENEDGETIYRTRVDGHPPYPFVRPAIREFKANPRTFITDNTEFGSIGEIDSVDELVRSVAFALESQMKKNATANSTDRSPGTHPNHPQVDTGTLRASISAIKVS